MGEVDDRPGAVARKFGHMDALADASAGSLCLSPQSPQIPVISVHSTQIQEETNENVPRK
jgi:hypothetical protein